MSQSLSHPVYFVHCHILAELLPQAKKKPQKRNVFFRITRTTIALHAINHQPKQPVFGFTTLKWALIVSQPHHFTVCSKTTTPKQLEQTERTYKLGCENIHQFGTSCNYHPSYYSSNCIHQIMLFS